MLHSFGPNGAGQRERLHATRKAPCNDKRNQRSCGKRPNAKKGPLPTPRWGKRPNAKKGTLPTPRALSNHTCVIFLSVCPKHRNRTHRDGMTHV